MKPRSPKAAQRAVNEATEWVNRSSQLVGSTSDDDSSRIRVQVLRVRRDREDGVAETAYLVSFGHQKISDLRRVCQRLTIVHHRHDGNGERFVGQMMKKLAPDPIIDLPPWLSHVDDTSSDSSLLTN